MNPELKEMLVVDRFVEAKLILKIFIFFSLVYLGFAVADYIYAQDRIVEFLLLRVAYCIIPISIFLLADRIKSFRQTEQLALFNSTAASGIITYMIFTTQGFQSPYYAGLNLVGFISLCFYTLSWQYFWLNTASIYLPYFILAVLSGTISKHPEPFVLNALFISGTIMGSALLHHAREHDRFEKIFTRFQLKQELDNRNEIILKKTEEAVKLSALSSQFSPQIIESIRSGKINLELGSQRVPVCAIFIDIVNSTERANRIEKEKVEKVLTKFLDDSIKILLKYDITIDKFLGDGILGFCNAPLARSDYTARVVSAALEVRQKIKMDQEFFERHWQKELEIRIGIAKGYANVGFYGSKKYYRSYTAIGLAINLASRLCTSAEPGQILIDYDVFEEIQTSFDAKFLNKRLLKGFEQDTVFVYEVNGSKSNANLDPGINECAQCGSILSVEINSQGQFVFMCKQCCSVVESLPMEQKKTASQVQKWKT